MPFCGNVQRRLPFKVSRGEMHWRVHLGRVGEPNPYTQPTYSLIKMTP